MTLPASGPITAAQIRAELGLAPGTPFTIPSPEIRGLTGVASGPIVWPNDFWGKGRSISILNMVTDTTVVADYGIDTPSRRIWILACGGSADNNNAYNITGTISGAAATVIRQDNTTVSGVQTVSAILVGAPTGTSGTVVIGGGGGHTLGFYLLRTTGYSSAATYVNGTPPFSWAVNVPTNGMILGVANNHNSIGTPIWSGITHRSSNGAAIGNNHLTSLGFDTEQPANGARTVSFSPASGSAGVSVGCIATFAPS